ncbi:MAG: hypothetical protein U0271_44765 [Polyangiaceae bacterium]
MGPRTPGQISGRGAGFDWGEYVAWLVRERGSLAAVASAMAAQRRGAEHPDSVERALRRLRARGFEDGGAWGARAVQCFGMPADVFDRLRWMGLYHSRFSDLPVPICVELLRSWDRPPVAQSAARALVQLGLAHCALRSASYREALAALDRARAAAGSDALSHAEERLARAYCVVRKGDGRAPAWALLGEADELIASLERSADRACLDARSRDQRAYLLVRGSADERARARELLFAIPESGPVFARLKRCLGLAYCHKLEGELDAARELARAALTAAGDGGFVRHRAIALGLLARLTTGEESASFSARAASLAAELGDEDLRTRARSVEGRQAEG